VGTRNDITGRFILGIAAIVFAGVLSGCAGAPAPISSAELEGAQYRLPSGFSGGAGDRFWRRGTGFTPMRIVVNKGERLLRVYAGDQVLRSYRIGLGFTPYGAKQRKGDGRTPEGDYYITNKNDQSNFLLSLGLNYPNDKDAHRAFMEGVITEAEYDSISRASYLRTLPPWNTPLGGAIFIHGWGSDKDWTEGCIALNDRDVQDLYRLVQVGTPVKILP
jgi:lipoprotein-anchoring transpeptidase ErfK/SrfK